MLWHADIVKGLFPSGEELCSFKWPTQYKSNLHVPHVKGHSINDSNVTRHSQCPMI